MMPFRAWMPLFCECRPHPGQAGADQPAVQRHQVQPAPAARSRGVRPRPPDAHPHQRARHRRGPGPDKLAQLFQPFNRLGKEAGAEEGTGIGLVVTKRLVELMGGRSAWTAPSAWAAFWIELARPSRRRSLRPGVPRCAALRTTRAAGRAGAAVRTLLYVEDNPANLELVEQLIARRARPAPAQRGGRHAGHRVRARLPARRDPDGHQPARHQRGLKP
jgi:hypothetical protein